MESSQNNMLLAAIKVQNAAAVEASATAEVLPIEATSAVEPPLSVPEAPAPEPPTLEPVKEPVVSEVLKPPKPKPSTNERDWERFSFVCSKDIIQKIHDISEKEHFSIREVMELFLQRGISDYEKKNGVAKARKRKSVDSIL
ncbi:MAG: hypothetical protein MJZ16_09255 [Bacteroidales bacterium]|nr:hypothetical protein [Bacteroidales bacterium]